MLFIASLSSFFTEIITSESAGYRKPDPRVFDFALAKAGASKQESIMIGDNLATDISGAKNAGILAAKMLGAHDPEVQKRVLTFTQNMEASVLEKANKLEDIGYKAYLDKQ